MGCCGAAAGAGSCAMRGRAASAVMMVMIFMCYRVVGFAEKGQGGELPCRVYKGVRHRRAGKSCPAGGRVAPGLAPAATTYGPFAEKNVAQAVFLTVFRLAKPQKAV